MPEISVKSQVSSVKGKLRNCIAALLPSYRAKKGFTLIELLIAISIVAILSTVAFISYSQSQKIARDAKRKQDLKSISTALELFYQKNGQFPAIAGDWINSSAGGNWITGGNPVTTLDTTYINYVPADPVNNSSGCSVPAVPSANNCFIYAYQSGDFNPLWGVTCPDGMGAWYILAARLENTDDPDINSKKHYKTCAGVDTATDLNWGGGWANTYIVTP